MSYIILQTETGCIDGAYAFRRGALEALVIWAERYPNRTHQMLPADNFMDMLLDSNLYLPEVYIEELRHND